MLVATDYPFIDIVGSMLFFFAFVIWMWLLFSVFGDLFRRHDIGGWAKAGWIIFVIVLPFLGVLVYLGTQAKGIAERRIKEVESAQAQFDEYVRRTAASSGPAAEIAQAKQLLENGSITQEEFDDLKRKALA